jgi:hypothetical protein
MPGTEHIFIGGLFRTGTDLIRNALNAAPDVRIAGETHFLGDPTVLDLLQQGRSRRFPVPAPDDSAYYLWRLSHLGNRRTPIGPGGIPTDQSARIVVDHIYDHVGRHDRAFWYWLVKNVERDDFLAHFLQTERTDRGLFELMMAYYAQGRPIHGEKTPAHLHHVPTLLGWFSKAKFVHMMRDPRAVLVSQRQKRAASNSVSPLYRLFQRSPAGYDAFLTLGISANWLRAAQLHDCYRQRYPNRYYLVRFEDLVTEPRQQLARLCQFLEIQYSEVMLERRVVNSSFVPRDQVLGFDPSVTSRWREHLHPVTNRWLRLLCGRHLADFGY